MAQFLRKVLLASLVALSGCAGDPLVRNIAEPRDIPSSLVHGVDSSAPISEAYLAFAQRCLSGSTPRFWARYFNHSDIVERVQWHPSWAPNRADRSFRVAERALLASNKIGLLPVFGQNVNHLGEDDGLKHGQINAKDLIDYVGGYALRKHFASKPLLVGLNQETSDGPLTPEYWRGWTRGLKEGLKAVNPSGTQIRAVVYARPKSAHPHSEILKVSLEKIQSTDAETFAGIWPVSPVSEGLNANTRGGPKECGRLASWGNSLGASVPDGSPLRVLMRQYVERARDASGREIDINAVNPEHDQDFLKHLIAFDAFE